MLRLRAALRHSLTAIRIQERGEVRTDSGNRLGTYCRVEVWGFCLGELEILIIMNLRGEIRVRGTLQNSFPRRSRATRVRQQITCNRREGPIQVVIVRITQEKSKGAL